jgi:hypothetical protein
MKFLTAFDLIHHKDINLINDLDRRAIEMGYTIKWYTFTEYVNKILSNKELKGDIDFSNEYCEYINKYANFIYLLEINKKDMDNGLLDFTK